MKSAVALLLPATIAAAVVEPRQAPKITYTHEKLTPQIKPNAQRTLTRIGPITFTGQRGFSMDPSGQSFLVNVPKGTFCDGKACTILSGQVGLELPNKEKPSPSSGIYLHHILAFNNLKKNTPFVSGCDYTPERIASVAAPRSAGAGFVGGSEDNVAEPIVFTVKDGNLESGYHLGANDGIAVTADIVRTNKDVKQLYLTYDLEWLPGLVGSDAQGNLMSVKGCGLRPIKTSANGATNTTSNHFKFFQDGYVINAKGHLHDGGERMIVEFYGKNGGPLKSTCVSEAKYGGQGHHMGGAEGGMDGISGMTVCRGPVEVQAGDTMKMISEYDLQKHPLRAQANGKKAEVMGMWTQVFIAKAKAA